MRSYKTSTPQRAVVRGPIKLALVVVATIPALGGFCGGGPEPVNPGMAPVPRVAEVYYADGGAIRDSLRLVIRDANTLRDRWAEATSDRTQSPDPPQVNFENEMVILVSAGRKRVGDEIRVDSVRVGPAQVLGRGTEDVMTVFVLKIKGCGSFDQDVWPLQLVRVPAYDGIIRFADREVDGPDCGRTALEATARRGSGRGDQRVVRGAREPGWRL